MAIKKLIAKGESETLEFKTSFGKDVIETLSAFSNHKGGTVLVGVAGDGKIVGASFGEESLQKWANEIIQSTSPSIMPDIQQIKTGKKDIILFRVGEFPVKPVACRGRYYKRIANSNHKLTLTEIANLHLQSLQISWDSYEAEGQTIENLSEDKIQKFIDTVNNSGRFKAEGDNLKVLEKLGYINNGVPAHAALLLFSTADPVHNVHIGRFKTPSKIIDDRMLRGTLFNIVEETMKFIISHIKVAFEIGNKLERDEIFEYPIPALRELVLNAVIHRDYTSPVDIQIKIFDNSITFFNPGRLFGDLTVEDLKNDNYQSSTRNKLVAEAFYLTKDIEKYGTGLIRVRNEIKNYPTMNLRYEEIGNGFLVTVSYEKQKISSDHREGEGLSEGVSKGIKLLYSHIKENPGQRTPEIAESLKTPAKTVERWLSELKDTGLIEYRGSNRTGGYYPLKD